MKKFLEKIFNFSKNNFKEGAFFIILWMLIWGTYNADLFRIFDPGFPSNKIDLIHGLRTFLPFISVILAIYFLIIKRDNLPPRFFSTPLGLLSIYAGIGIFSSIFSKNLIGSLYWGILYASPLIVLSAILTSQNSIKKLSTIISLNWLIAGLLSVLLIIIFLVQPGVVSSLTGNFLICQARPFEGIAGIITAAPSLGVFGTRPTGLGRYAAIATIVAFAFLFGQQKHKKYIIWLSSFFVFFIILMFSKGRTALGAFIISIIAILWLIKKLRTRWILFVICAIGLTALVTFFNIPCVNGWDFIKSLPQYSIINNPNSNLLFSGSYTPPVESEPGVKSIWTILTLSGRVSGAWKESYNLFLKSPIIGYGFQADRYFLNGEHAHNTIVQSILQTGLLGTFFLVYAFVLTFIALWKDFFKKDIDYNKKYFLLAMIGVFIFFAGRSVTESSGAYFDADWLFLAPIIAYVSVLEYNYSIKK